MLKFINAKSIFESREIKNDFQIFDLLQLSKKERECRALCISSMQKFDRWKRLQNSQGGSVLNFYEKIEGVMLRRQVQDAILFYRIIRNDRVRAFQAYMEKLPARSGVFGASS